MKKKAVKSNSAPKWLRLLTIVMWINGLMTSTNAIDHEKPAYLREIQAACVKWEVELRTVGECLEYHSCGKLITTMCERTGNVISPPCTQTM